MMRAPDWWWTPGRSGFALLLQPVAAVYAAIARRRRRQARPVRADVPLICVGNLVVGGAGKTPTVIAVAQRLKNRGLKVHILTRGYGGKLAGPLQVQTGHHTHADVGDEALLLARHAPTWIARKRADGVKAAAVGADVILMDDGFQNPFVAPDASILVVDAVQGFGNGCVLPAGPLREDIASGLTRATCVQMTGPGAPDESVMAAIRRAGKPVFDARLETDIPDVLTSGPVIAFAGIGRPDKFFAALTAGGVNLVTVRSFSDHYPYTADDLKDLEAKAKMAGARLATTEKDVVRLPAFVAERVVPVPAHLIWPDPSALDAVIDAALHSAKRPS